ncbi:hypothetical protein F4810DRAFT_676977, partial [Camillea tinctor]
MEPFSWLYPPPALFSPDLSFSSQQRPSLAPIYARLSFNFFFLTSIYRVFNCNHCCDSSWFLIGVIYIFVDITCCALNGWGPEGL